MNEEWTGDVVKAIHIHKITQNELANEMGVTSQYVSMVLNGAKKPEGIRERMEAAISAIVQRRPKEDR